MTSTAKPRILFTGGGGVGNEALARLLEDRYEIFFGDADPANVAPTLDPARVKPLPRADDPGFVPALAGLCDALDIDVLVPGVDEELPLMKDLARVSPDLGILIPDADFVATMLDKQGMVDRLRAAGIAMPATKPSEAADLIGYPLVLKPRSGRGSRAVRLVSDAHEAACHLRLEAAYGPFIAQEALDGIEYTVCMAADREARLAAIVPVRVAVKKGITLRAETEPEPRVIKACLSIHEACPTSGCYNIQGILSASGQFRPFEINPRISTTFCLVQAAGIDPIAIYLDGTGKDGAFSTFARVRLSRHFVNTFEPVGQRPGGPGGIG